MFLHNEETTRHRPLSSSSVLTLHGSGSLKSSTSIFIQDCYNNLRFKASNRFFNTTGINARCTCVLTGCGVPLENIQPKPCAKIRQFHSFQMSALTFFDNINNVRKPSEEFLNVWFCCVPWFVVVNAEWLKRINLLSEMRHSLITSQDIMASLSTSKIKVLWTADRDPQGQRWTNYLFYKYSAAITYLN